MRVLVPVLETAAIPVHGTVIQSGNLVVESTRNPADAIGALIERNFGFRPATLALRCSDFSKAAAACPFVDDSGKAIHFWFCVQKPKPDEAALQRYCAESERYRLIGKVLYLHAPEGIGRSRLAANMETSLGVAATGRNLNTVNALLDLCLSGS